MDSENARFKQARDAAGVTLEELAASTGYSIGTISGVENGHDAPSKRLRSELIRQLEINESWLTKGSGEMFAPSRTKSISFVLDDLSNEDVLKCAEFAHHLTMTAPKAFLRIAGPLWKLLVRETGNRARGVKKEKRK